MTCRSSLWLQAWPLPGVGGRRCRPTASKKQRKATADPRQSNLQFREDRAMIVRIFDNGFEPGILEVDPAAGQVLSLLDIFEGLFRHLAGDWGDVTDEERRANDAATQYGGR